MKLDYRILDNKNIELFKYEKFVRVRYHGTVQLTIRGAAANKTGMYHFLYDNVREIDLNPDTRHKLIGDIVEFVSAEEAGGISIILFSYLENNSPRLSLRVDLIKKDFLRYKPSIN